MKPAKTILIVSIVLTTLVWISSCKKDETDTENPVISVVEPAMNDTFTMSIEPEVHIEFTVTDNKGLREINVKVTNGLGTEIFSEKQDLHSLKIFSFHEHFLPAGITAPTPLTVTLKATDQKDNETVKIIPIIVRP